SAGVDRTSRLVRQLLDLAAIEAGEGAPALATGRPVEIMERVVAEMPPGDCAVVIENSDGNSGIEARYDPSFLTMAVRNLIENAVRHSPEGGTVTVRLAQAGGRVDVSIQDDGPGIPEGDLPRVTERFFRGHDRSSAGSGLGLS